MNEEVPATAGGWLSEWFSNVKVPGAFKAISRLVGSAADAGSALISIGTAKAEQAAQKIKDDTAARTLVTRAVAKEAAKTAAADAGFVDRSLSRWAGDQVRKQENREAVAKKTIEHLNEEPAPQTTDGPADDWMNIFESHAERASSEKLRETWARVLAGEIRRPGSFSFRTLQFVSVLDQSIANIIEELASGVFDARYILFDDVFHQGEWLEKMSVLEETGFLRKTMLQARISIGSGGYAACTFKKLGLVVYGEPGHVMPLDVAILSPVGREIIAILSPEDDFEMIKRVARALVALGGKDPKVGRRMGEQLVSLMPLNLS